MGDALLSAAGGLDAIGELGAGRELGAEDAGHDHSVCFHGQALGLLIEIIDFVEPVLREGGAAMVVVRGARFAQFDVLLSRRGFEPERLRADGRLVVLDAEALADVFASRGELDLAALESYAGGTTRRLVARFSRVRIFGETVDVLVERGAHDIALALERWWSELQRELPFDLLCGYELGRFGASDRAPLRTLCAVHGAAYAVDGEAPTLRGLRRGQLEANQTHSSGVRVIDTTAREASRPSRPLTAREATRGRAQEPEAPRVPPKRLTRPDPQQSALSKRELGPLTVGRLVNVVLHDLANLLSVVRYNALELEALLAGDARVAEPLADLVQVIDQGTALTRDVLGLSRNSERKPTPFDDLVDSQRRLLARMVGDKASLTLELGCPALVDLSPTEMSQVLTNLVVNATHAVIPGGGICVRTNVGAGGQWAALEVRDDGVGMDATLLDRVFDEAFTTRSDSGMGLGLAIVRQVVEGVGGRVEVESNPGGGALFRVLVPVSSVTPSPA